MAAPSGRTIPFMIQPLYAKSQLVEEILAVEDPSPGHPVLLALANAILATGADERQALDSQVSNFAWVNSIGGRDGSARMAGQECQRPTDGVHQPLSSDEIHERISRMHGELKVMKRLMRAQRWWATKVRRQPYDTFITDSFTGALL